MFQQTTSLDSDPDHIYVHVKNVMDRMKLYRKEVIGSSRHNTCLTHFYQASGDTLSTSEVSDHPSSPKKKRVVLTRVEENKEEAAEEELVDTSRRDIMFSMLGIAPKASSAERKKATSTSVPRPASEQVEVSRTCFNPALTRTPSPPLLSRSPSPQPGSSVIPEMSSKSARHLRKLEKALAKCAENIKKFEEAPIDWENEDESNFIMADKLKKRFMEIYGRIAEYKKTSVSIERRKDKKFVFHDSKYPDVSRKIEKLVNRTKEFPDFTDIKSQIETVNLTKRLHLTDQQIHTEADRIFVAVGRKLKIRRFDDDADSMYSYLKEDEVDPAAGDKELQSKLNKQGKVAKQKLDKVFEEFVDKQDRGAAPEESSDDVNSDNEDDAEEEEEDTAKTMEGREADDESDKEGYDSEEVEEYEKNLAAYDEMVGAGSAEEDGLESEIEDEEGEDNIDKRKTKGGSRIKYIKDIDLGSEESEEEVEMIELDGEEESDSDEVVECEEEHNDDDIQVDVKEVPDQHLEGATKERKSSGSLNSLLDSDNDDCDANFGKSM